MALQKKPGLMRRLLSKLGLVVFGLLIGCLLAELALRVAGYSYPEFYQPDDSRGYALRPNMAGWYRKEGAAYININSDGLRDREHVKAKAPDTIRVAVIGDSYPEALPVGIEDAFWTLLARKLEQCAAFGGKKIEVINFGVSGYGTAQELITLRERVWSYSPDVVMLAVTTNNDISDNVRQLKKTDQVPYFSYRDGKLSLDDSFKETRAFRWRRSALNRLGRWLRDRSRVIQAINQGHHGLKIWLESKRAPKAQAAQPLPEPQREKGDKQTGNAAAASEELGIDNLIYLEPRDQTWNDAWRVTEALIKQMHDEVQSHGARFVVVTLSNGIQVYPDANARRLFMQRLGISDLFYPDHRLKEFAGRERIPIITLAPELAAYAEQNKVFLHGFGNNLGNGHWNQQGHRVAADLIAQKLCGGVLQ